MNRERKNKGEPGLVAYDVIGLKVREPMREKMRSRMPHTQSLIKLIHIVSMYKRESVRILVTVSSLFRIFKMKKVIANEACCKNSNRDFEPTG